MMSLFAGRHRKISFQKRTNLHNFTLESCQWVEKTYSSPRLRGAHLPRGAYPCHHPRPPARCHRRPSGPQCTGPQSQGAAARSARRRASRPAGRRRAASAAGGGGSGGRARHRASSAAGGDGLPHSGPRDCCCCAAARRARVREAARAEASAPRGRLSCVRGWSGVEDRGLPSFGDCSCL